MSDRVSREPCFYCGALVREIPGESEADHFPIPKRWGGAEKVRACIPCHDMKDRIGIGQWPVDWFASVWRDFRRVSRDTRILMLRLCNESGPNIQAQIADIMSQNSDECLACEAKIAKAPTDAADEHPLFSYASKQGIGALCDDCRGAFLDLSFNEWPQQHVDAVLGDISKVGREMRLFLAKFLDTVSDYVWRSNAK